MAESIERVARSQEAITEAVESLKNELHEPQGFRDQVNRLEVLVGFMESRQRSQWIPVATSMFALLVAFIGTAVAIYAVFEVHAI